ncbi:DMT family transporter [Macrococcoides caseolyticum]|uniref:DMT family transporter n=1 Tax=Macrococcoides caseolyticum TaxID=69966 RepID=UPI001F2EA039|nr:DMT family transporter [Macrococcus caseolyticus]MCE4955869.1 DMT family transporter [Macrococcus caseolyticus]
MDNKLRGIIWLLIASLGFSLMGLFVKLSGDLPVVQKSLFRNIVGMILPLYFVYRHQTKLFGQLKNQPLLMLRSLFGLTGVLLNYYTIDKMILSDADMLNKLSPFFTIIFCALFLKEHIRKYQLLCMLIAFFGALFIIKPSMQTDMHVALIGVAGALFAALAYTTLRVLGTKEPFYTTVFYFSFFSTMALLPLTYFQYEPMTHMQVVYLLLSGVFATMGQFGLTIAYQHAAAKDISIFTYSTVLFSAIIGLISFHEVPDVLSIAGYIIIFSASYYMFERARQTNHSQN